MPPSLINPLSMKFAIIAAGEGSRLQQEGVALPKPLVHVGGEALIDRLFRIFRGVHAEQIVVIVNTLNPLTEEHVCKLQQQGLADDVQLVVKSTPSSMHSFFELSPYLDGAPFCLTTVDTIFREKDFANYIHAFETSQADGLMAVTDYIDDEKPLYVQTDENLRITAFCDTDPGTPYISGGMYCLRQNALDVLRSCIANGQSRMRNYQRALIAAGLHLQAYPFSKVLDIDHASDIAKAEAFLQS